MENYRDTDESFGVRALNWIVIAGAAILLLASVAAPTQKVIAPLETVTVTATHADHA